MSEQLHYTSHSLTSDELPPDVAAAARDHIVEATTGDPGLLGVSHNDIDDWVDSEGTFTPDTQQLVSVAAAKGPYRHNDEEYVEIGSFYTDPEHRRQGLVLANAAAVTARALERGQIPIGFANDKSLAIFTEDLDYDVVTDAAEVPPEMLEACGGLASCETARACGKLCCDTIVKHPGFESDPPLQADIADDNH